MATQAFEFGGRPAIFPGVVRRPGAAADRSLPDVIRGLVAVILLVLALGLVAVTTDLAGAAARAQEGPTPGFAL